MSTLLILDMPDESPQLLEWLERHLAGLTLAQLVDELAAVHGDPAESITLEAACEKTLPDILSSGLQALKDGQLHTLLTHPKLLLELQDRISFDGGDYWLSIPISDEHQAAVERGWEKLQATINSADGAVPSQPEQTSDPWGNTPNSNRRSMLRNVLVACGLFLAVGVGTMLLRQPAGWADPGRLTANRSPSEVFSALAKATESYASASRKTPAQLQQEIERFVRDCRQVQKLDLPELAALPHPDREDENSPIQNYDDWLKVKCKAWEDKTQATLTAMQDGNSDFELASSAYTEILTKLKSALEKQATALA